MPPVHRLGLGLLLLTLSFGQTHFTPVDSTGLPYTVIIEPDSTAFYVLQAGDEIGLFDDTLCVGADVYNGNGNFPITAWEGSPDYSLPGFTVGDSILIKLWTDMGNGPEEFICTTDFSVGDGTYGYGSYSVCTVDILDTTVVFSSEDARYLVRGFELEQNYPNPFNAVTQVRFSIMGEPKPVLLQVYDLHGRVVEKLVDKVLIPGVHTVQWNASKLSSGVYFYRLRTTDGQITKKMVVVK